MNNATESKVLTKEQEDFVWRFICCHMDSEDRDPIEVIAEDYNGNRSRYLQIMAAWHGIKFCDVCGKPKQKGVNPCCCRTWS